MHMQGVELLTVNYKNKIEPPVAATSTQRLVFQNTKSLQVKSLYLEPCKRPPLVSDRDHF